VKRTSPLAFTGGFTPLFTGTVSRDTFAAELLLAGIPIERVSVLLGHQSVRITERHYSPWAKSRQEQLEADPRKHGNAIYLAQELGATRHMARTRDILNAVSLYFIRESIGGAGGNRTKPRR
jgi:hypothetical protein